MNHGIIIQLQTFEEFMDELRTDAERVNPKVIRSHVQMVPAPSTVAQQKQAVENKRNVWLVLSAVMLFGGDNEHSFLLRSEIFTGEYWVTEQNETEKAGYQKALNLQKELQRFCQAQKWQMKSGVYRYQNEQV